MNRPQINAQLLQLVKSYWQWRWVWLSSTAAFTLLGVLYVVFLKSDTWVASQGLIIRDEANGAVMRLGRFQSQTEMKAAQETVLEMSRNTQVLQDALQQVGRSPTWFGWSTNTSAPTPAEIESLAKNCIEVRAPRGAELGTTEVIYLDVKQDSRGRALQLSKAVCEALENQLQNVRQARADGVISELTTAKDAASAALQLATARLQEIEAEAGADLSDLRGLTDSNTGGSTNKQLLDTVKSELRQVELNRHQLTIDMNLAVESFDNPDALLLTPTRLVSNQPGIKKLREGLADAAITTAGLKGRYTENNPLVQAAVENEEQIRDQLRTELGVAIQTLAKDIEVADQQLTTLRSQQEQLESRLTKLARIRAQYSNVVSEVRARNLQLQETERELAQAMASRDAALTSSLITRLDSPIVGDRPIGPGRTTIAAGFTMCGLFFGLGLVFLLLPTEGEGGFGRRRSDLFRTRGRRAADVLASDAALASPSLPADAVQPDPNSSDAHRAPSASLPERRTPASSAAALPAATVSPKPTPETAPERQQTPSDKSAQPLSKLADQLRLAPDSHAPDSHATDSHATDSPAAPDATTGEATAPAAAEPLAVAEQKAAAAEAPPAAAADNASPTTPASHGAVGAQSDDFFAAFAPPVSPAPSNAAEPQKLQFARSSKDKPARGATRQPAAEPPGGPDKSSADVAGASADSSKLPAKPSEADERQSLAAAHAIISAALKNSFAGQTLPNSTPLP